ncbi:S1 family peptidase [Lacimicrobium alkaliphilum]|uniref:Peptidase S1 n=1 Tax=Lacimicrobium alkaliphilum TaxID=1526571 RepID=A0A0U2QNG8_9ALTE|nr:serine protease [Lacimicrobium alkaliphilum]ALS99131.1 peptidase S1 [Lacimicrobium alkaliphilum]
MFKIISLVVLSVISLHLQAQSFESVVSKVKGSVVGIGVHDPLGAPKNTLQGTGFAVGDGKHIVTNFHVVERALDAESMQKRVVFVGQGERPDVLEAEIVITDPAHDLAVLKINKKVAPFKLAETKRLPDGREVAFTGFPIGAVLGLYPATHRGYIAASTPVVTPSANAQQLSIEMIKRMKEPFVVYQLDATAYPGNSGSPVYDVKTGEIVAIINKVFVTQSKESALSAPSGISYAIPVEYLQRLLQELND